MKILLINCPSVKKFIPMESLGIAYLASVLRKNNYEVETIDSDLMWSNLNIDLQLQKIYQKLDSEDYDLVGLSLIDESYFSASKIIDYISNLKAKRRIHLMLGGYLPSFADKELMQKHSVVDFIIRGEGEIAIVQLVDQLRGLKDYSAITGLTYRKNNEIIRNDNSILIEEVDEIPFPSRDHILEVKRNHQPVAISSSRGCNGKCIYCAISSFYKKCEGKYWRGRSPKNVVDEIEMIYKTYDMNHFVFVDDEFIGSKDHLDYDRVTGIADEIINRGLDITFEIFCRSDSVNIEVMKRLKRAGLKKVFLGIESSLDSRLKFMGKGIRFEEHKQAMKTLGDANINYIIGFIPMDPFIKIEEVREEFKFLRSIQELKSFKGNPSMLSRDTRILPYYGTPFQKHLQNKNMLKGEFPLYAYDFEDPKVDTLFNTLKSMQYLDSKYRFIVNESEISNIYISIFIKMYGQVLKEKRIYELDFALCLVDMIDSLPEDKLYDEIENLKINYENKLKALESRLKELKDGMGVNSKKNELEYCGS